jgi:hypothetical protein
MHLWVWAAKPVATGTKSLAGIIHKFTIYVIFLLNCFDTGLLDE